jgi:uncharacterized protein YjbJ (UPF0337 family)
MGDQMDRAKGRVKEAAGDLTGDRDMQREGKADRTGGAIKEKAGNLVDSVKDALTGTGRR